MTPPYGTLTVQQGCAIWWGPHLSFFCCDASRRVASCSSSVSISDDGSCTYRMTEPRTKQFFTDCCARQQPGRTSAYCTARGSHACIQECGRAFVAERTGGQPYHVREVRRVLDSHVQQLDVEELVDRVQRATDCQVCGVSRVGLGQQASRVGCGTNAPFFSSTTISLPTRVLKKE